MGAWDGLGRTAAGAIGALAAGAAIGVAAEQFLVGRRLRRDPEEAEEFGSLHGRSVSVTAIDGVELHAEISEPDDPAKADLTVVFTHGYALNQDCWHYQRRDLRNVARMVFWDQRSHGKSQRGGRETHTIDQLGFDLAEVIKATVPEGPIVLVGHSMGGMTLMSLAAHYPEIFAERVVGVALLATSSGNIAESTFGLPVPPAWAKKLHQWAPKLMDVVADNKEIIELSREQSSDLYYLLTKRYSFGSDVAPSVAQFTVDMLNGTGVDVVAEFLPTFDQHDKAEALEAMQGVETVVMVGTRDLMTPESHSEEIVRRLPHAELVLLPDTGHMLMLERYPEVNEHLRLLIARARRSLGSEESVELV